MTAFLPWLGTAGTASKVQFSQDLSIQVGAQLSAVRRSTSKYLGDETGVAGRWFQDPMRREQSSLPFTKCTILNTISRDSRLQCPSKTSRRDGLQSLRSILKKFNTGRAEYGSNRPLTASLAKYLECGYLHSTWTPQNNPGVKQNVLSDQEDGPSSHLQQLNNSPTAIIIPNHSGPLLVSPNVLTFSNV